MNGDSRTWCSSCRPPRGRAVYFILEQGRRQLAIEVKGTAHPGQRDLEGLRAFLKENPNAAGGLLVHCGREIRRMDAKIVSVPWTLLTGEETGTDSARYAAP